MTVFLQGFQYYSVYCELKGIYVGIEVHINGASGLNSVLNYTKNILRKFQEWNCTHSLLCSLASYESFTGWHFLCISNVHVINRYTLYVKWNCCVHYISCFLIGYGTPKRTLKFTLHCFKHVCMIATVGKAISKYFPVACLLVILTLIKSFFFFFIHD